MMRWGPGPVDLLEHHQRSGAAAAIPALHMSRKRRLRARKRLQVFTVNIWFSASPVKKSDKNASGGEGAPGARLQQLLHFFQRTEGDFQRKNAVFRIGPDF